MACSGSVPFERAVKAARELPQSQFQTLDLCRLANGYRVQLTQGVFLVCKPGLQINQLFLQSVHQRVPVEHAIHPMCAARRYDTVMDYRCKHSSAE